MANRVPLIINTTANQIQELAVGDSLDLTASGIHNAGVITATKFVGDGSLLTNIGGGSAALQDLVDDLTPQLGGNLDINGKIINGSGSIVVTGGIQATSFTGDLIGNATSATTANSATTATTATNAAGLTGSPAIQVASVVATGHIQADTVSVASTLTYEDVTNIDSVGVVTARTGIKVLAGGINAIGVTTSTSFDGALDATDLLSGTIPDARFPAVLPAIDGSALTNLPPGGISNIVEDTTPQLGGDLDLNSKSILGTTNIKVDVASGPAIQVMLSNNAVAGNATTPDVSVLGFASGGSLKASIRAAVYGEGWMSFHNNNDSEKMRLTAGGALGIGTVTPDTELHVIGQIKVDDSNYARVEYARDDINLWSVGLRDTDDFWFFRESGSANVLFPHGSVGIATDAPVDAWLDIASSAGTDSLRMRRISDDVNIASNWSVKPYGKNLYFREGASSPYDRVHFTDTGNVVSVGEFQDANGPLRTIPFAWSGPQYTLAKADVGKAIEIDNGAIINAGVFAAGDIITLINGTGSDMTIVAGTSPSTMVVRNSNDGGSTGDRTLGARGMCTVYFKNQNNAYISGAGLT